MFKGIVVGVLGTVLLGLLAVWVVIITGAVPAGASRPPSALERWAAMTSLHARIERDARDLKSPVVADEQNLLAGVNVYARHCVGCHGASDAKPSDVARGLYQRPPQLAAHGVEDDPEGFTYWKVDHGIRWTGMPSFGATLSRREIWEVAMFLKHMNSLPPPVERAWKEVPSVGASAGATAAEEEGPAAPEGAERSARPGPRTRSPVS